MKAKKSSARSSRRAAVKTPEGEITFDSNNYIHFAVIDDEEEDGDGVMLEFDSSPTKFVKNLREVADWIEKHKSDVMCADID